jgi:hypothetical protein
MDVRLPDGTVIQNVPEGTTKAQLMEKLKGSGYNLGAAEPAAEETAPEKPKKGMLEGALESGAAFARGAYEAIPFRKDISAARQRGSETAVAFRKAVAELGEEEAKRKFYAGELTPDFADVKKRREAESAALAEASPVASLAGTVAGAIATPTPFGKYGALEKGVKGLGQRMLGSAAGAGTVGGLTGLGEGTTIEDRLGNAARGAAFGTAVGGAASPVVAGLGALGRVVAGPTISTARALVSPKGALNIAEEKAARALAAGTDNMTEAEFRALRAADEPVIIGDVGGEPLRSMAKSASNRSAEARAILEKEIYDRSAQQTARVEKDVEKFFPTRPDYADDIAALKKAARSENKPAYDRAYDQGASNVFSSKIWDLTKSEGVKKAMVDADKIANDLAIAEGRPLISNPFMFDKAGNLVAKPNAKATDVNLRYMDAVKQNLDDQVDSLYRNGNKKAGGALSEIRDQFVKELDRLVPTYSKARGTAAEWFGAQDAYNAGINFARFSDPKKISEAVKFYKEMMPGERELFARGYTFDLLSEVGKVKDNRSIVNSRFMGSSPADRAKNLMALGKDRSAALEARLRVESIMDRIGGAVKGRSDTVKQLAEYGIAGAATGTAFGGGIPYGPEALAGIMLRAGKGQADARVAKEIAKLITSKDPDVLAKLTAMAAKEPKVIPALRALDQGIGKGAGVLAAKKKED